MKIFVDANVVIDYLVDRMPFADDAEAVVDACVQDGNEGAFTGLTALCHGQVDWTTQC